MSTFDYCREKTYILTYAVKDFSSMNPFLVTDSCAKIRLNLVVNAQNVIVI